MANSERGEDIKMLTSSESVSDKNNTLHVSITNDETRNRIPNEVSEMLFPGILSDRQPHIHHMVSGQTI